MQPSKTARSERRPRSANVEITTHPPGFAHTKSTIATMAKLARAGSHSYAIRSCATKIVHDVPSKQVLGELQAIYRWVRDHVRYRFDPVGLEWVQSPARTIKERAGDCDDMATLIAALAGSLGHRWRFITVGPSADVMKHVAAQVWDGKGWLSLDPVLEPPAPSTAPRSDIGAFGRMASARARHIWTSDGAMLSGVPARCTGLRADTVRTLEDSRQRVRDLRRCGRDVEVVHTSSGGRIVLSSKRKFKRPGHIKHSYINGGGMLGGAVNSRGVALWEGELGDARLVHVEPQSRVVDMLRIRNRCGLRGLGGEVAPAERELWHFAAYYSSDPSMRDGAGIAPVAMPIYRSDGAPGRGIVLSAPPGTLQGGLGHIDGLGFGFLKKIGKAVGGAIKGVAKVVTKIPGVSAVAGLIPGGSLAMEAIKGVAKIGGKAGIKGAAGGALSALAKCLPEPPSRSDFLDLKADMRFNAGLCSKPDLKALEVLIQSKCISRAEAEKAAFDALATEQQKNRKQTAATAAAHAKAMANLRASQKKALAKLSAKLAAKKACACDKKAKAKGSVKAKASIKAKAAPALPAGSKQVYDAKLQRYVVYAPAPAKPKAKAKKKTISGRGAMLHGVGFIKPTLTLSLGSVLGRFGLATTAQASTAVAAVTAFVKKNGQPPQIKIPAVLAFQKADGKLAPDGLWGNNARAAAAWYLRKKIDSLPPVAKPYAKSKLTWKPPASKPPEPAPVPKPKAKPKPKPAPVVPLPKPAAPPAAIRVAPVVVREPPPAPAPSDYAPAPTEPPIPMTPARAEVPIAVAPPGMMVAAISKTPVLPAARAAGKPRAGKRRPAPMRKTTNGFKSPVSTSFDVYGPTIREDVSPLVWLAIGWALLHQHRRHQYAA